MDEKPYPPDDGDLEADKNRHGTNEPTDGRIAISIEETIVDSIDDQGKTKNEHHDWYDKSHLVILGLTFVAAVSAAIFTGWLAFRTNDMAVDSSKQLVAATRAWVVPTSAHIDGDISLNKNLRIKILFENVGKEAAWDVINLRKQGPIFDVTTDALGMPYVDINTNPWPVNQMCDAEPSRVINRRTIYPLSKNEDITYVLTAPPTVSQDFIDKKKSFTVIGCFVYRTPVEPAKLRHSPYCFYFQPKREAPINLGTFEFCPSGSANAD